MNLIRQARQNLETLGRVKSAVIATSISNSWGRSLDYGLDPHITPHDAVLSVQKFQERKQAVERVLTIARPDMELLSNQVAGSHNLVAFGDRSGTVIDTIVDTECAVSDIARAITLGSVWKEQVRGTNALGLVAKLSAAVTVTGSEHFFAHDGSIACAAAPIFSSDDQMVGILDVTSGVISQQRHTASLVTLAAQNISNRLFVEEHRDDLIILCHPRRQYLATQSAGMLAFDDCGRFLGRNAVAAEMFGQFPERKALEFCDIFQQSFGFTLDGVSRGETIVLRDWVNSTVFARLRLTRGKLFNLAPPSTDLTIDLAAIRIAKPSSPASVKKIIIDDELLCQNIQMSADAIHAGMSIHITGRSGYGLSEVANAIHNRIHAGNRKILIDCGIAEGTLMNFQLKGHVSEVSEAMLKYPFENGEAATIIIDGVEKLGACSNSVLKRLMAQINDLSNQQPEQGRWALIAIERQSNTGMQAKEQASIFDVDEDIWGHSFSVPSLAERTDMPKLVAQFLSEAAPTTKITAGALQELKRINHNLTFYVLRRILFLLARGAKTNVIRTTDVRSQLNWQLSTGGPCPKCAGHPVHEMKCAEIQKTVRECSGNVSLAARRMQISRTTIYKHIGREP